MGKASALTGTEKKAKKAGIKAAKAREKVAFPAYKKGTEKLEDILRGKHGVTTELSQLYKDLTRAGGMAEKYFEPHKQEAMRSFQQEILPQITGRFRDAGGSSALNQALGAAGANLERGLAADYSNLELGLAQSLLNQREQNKLAQLNAYLQSASGAMGQGINPILQGISQQAQYLPSRSGPTATQRLLGQGLEAGSTALAAYFSGGNPAATAAANQGSRMLTGKLGWGEGFQTGF